jgi:hypothetical protein
VGSGEFHLFAPPYIWESFIERIMAGMQSGCGILIYFTKCIFGVKLV